MKNNLNYLLVFALSAAVFGAVACSDDSSSSAAADDGKKDAATWDDLQVFDAKSDLPSCDKFDGVAAQVIDEKAFFACVDGEWTQIAVFAPTYDELPKCNAPMNDFCIDVGDGEESETAYICDEGTWIKGVDGSCLKGDENFDWGNLIITIAPMVEPIIKKLFQ
ncbi:hypothetical protein [Fibrobacter sp.]|uniref:hypothetical protein n=1 Tax=Fibrobacter sp. TaxID=35828 RepID=UPI00388DB047